MNMEERARILNEAMDANAEAIEEIRCTYGASEEGIKKMVALVWDYGKERGVSDITMREVKAAIGRHVGSLQASVDQEEAAIRDEERAQEIAGKSSSFAEEDKPLDEIVSEGHRKGEITDEELHEFEKIYERLGSPEEPNMSEERAVPTFYPVFTDAAHFKRWDGSADAWLWADMVDLRKRSIIETVARVRAHVGEDADLTTVPRALWYMDEESAEEFIEENREAIEDRDEDLKGGQ